MPYTVDSENLPKNVQDMPAEDRAVWVAAWNAAYAEKNDEAYAFAVANAAVEKLVEPEEPEEPAELMAEAVAPIEPAIEAPPTEPAPAPIVESHAVERVDLSPSGTGGREWAVTIVGPKTPADLISVNGKNYIKSKNNRLYSAEALKASVPMWEGIKVYDTHLTDAEFQQRQGMRSPRNEWIGVIENVSWNNASQSLQGTYKVIDDVMAQKYLAALELGVLNKVGLSIDSSPVMSTVQYEGRQWPACEGFQAVYSVDCVAEPAAGGSIDRLIAAQNLTRSIAMAEEIVVNANTQPVADAPAATPVTTVPDNRAVEMVQQLKLQISRDKKIAAAKLPEKIAGLVLEAYPDGRIYEEADLDKFITRAKEAQAEGDPSGRVNGAGRIEPGMDGKDKAEVAFLRLMAGNVGFRALETAKDAFVQERLPESYKAWTKSGRQFDNTKRVSEWVYNLLGGDPLVDQRAAEAVTTSSMSSIVKNALNVLLANSYSVRERWWEPIVRTEEVDTIDQATLVRVYGMNTLAVVNEGDAYTELTWGDDEETPTFVKKGNFAGVTLETLLKDKLNIIRRIPELLADSWYNTISSLVSGVFTVNSAAGPVLSDGGALFNATAIGTGGGHVNYLTSALSFPAFSASRQAMRKQTAQALGTGRRLLIEPKFLLVPVDLETTAYQIRDSEKVPNTANNDTNPYKGKFEVIQVPDWTDANNWALVGDPVQFPAIWLIFLRGKSVPELFTADNDAQGAMFTNDTLRYKVRMMTWRFSASYECAPVSDFRALHQNVVA